MFKPIMTIVRGRLFLPGTRVCSRHFKPVDPITGQLKNEVGTVISEAMYDKLYVMWDDVVRDAQIRTEDEAIAYMIQESYRDLVAHPEQLTVEEMLTHYAPLIRRRGQAISRKRNIRERTKQLVLT